MIEAFIRTKDNPIGLSILLWALVGQIRKPDSITILNTGKVIKKEEIYRALDFFPVFRIIKRPNEMYFDKDGVFNHSLQIIDCIQHFSGDLIWFFDGDLFVPSDCLEKLLKKVPSIPKFIVDIEPFEFEDMDKITHHGLLAKKKDWDKVPKILKKKKYPKIGEDCLVNKVINPFVNKDTCVFHTKSHGELHRLIYPELHNQLWK